MSSANQATSNVAPLTRNDSVSSIDSGVKKITLGIDPIQDVVSQIEDVQVEIKNVENQIYDVGNQIYDVENQIKSETNKDTLKYLRRKADQLRTKEAALIKKEEKLREEKASLRKEKESLYQNEASLRYERGHEIKATTGKEPQINPIKPPSITLSVFHYKSPESEIKVTLDGSLKTLKSLYDYLKDEHNLEGTLYEEREDDDGNVIYLRLLKLPTRGVTLRFSQNRRTPPVSTEQLNQGQSGQIDTMAPIFSQSFRALHQLTEAIVEKQNLVDNMGRVSFMEANMFLPQDILQPSAPSVPVFIDQKTNKSEVQFIYLRTETQERKKILSMLDSSSIAFLRGVSGCGKTTSMVSIGMADRSVYIEMDSYKWSYLYDSVEDLDERSRYHELKKRIISWILARISIILYLEEKYKLDPADIIAAQRSSAFESVVVKLWEELLKIEASPFSLLRDVQEIFPTYLMLDECHLFKLNHEITNKTINRTDNDPEHVMSPLSFLWTCLEQFRFKYLFATTHLQTSIDSAIKSLVGKTRMDAGTKFEFNEFTFHETPELLKSYVKDFPDTLCPIIAGRARFGSNTLYAIMERAKLTDEYKSDLETFYKSCVEIVKSFHTEGKTVENSVVFSNSATSLYSHLCRYLSPSCGIRTDHGSTNLSLHSALVTLMMAHRFPQTSENFAKDLNASQMKYVEKGIGFLENGTVTLREQLAVLSVVNLVSNNTLMEHFKALLMHNKIVFGPKEPIKGIVFQMIIQVAIMSLTGKTVGEVLSLWTGKSIKHLKQEQHWLKEVVNDRFKCERIIRESDANLVFEKLDGNTLVILENNARCEFVYRLPNSMLIITAGVKLLSKMAPDLLHKNETAATLARMFVSHNGLVLNAEKREIAKSYFVDNKIKNIGLVVTVTNDNGGFRYEFYDEHIVGSSQKMQSMFVYFDNNNLLTLLSNHNVSDAVLSFYK